MQKFNKNMNVSGWTLGSLVETISGKASPSLKIDQVVKNFFVGAWSCEAGSVYVPLRYPPDLMGGNVMIGRALKRGAVGVIVDEDEHLSDDVPYIRVADVNEAAQKIAQISRDRFQGKMVAVTGTAGKTTTVAMTARIMREHGKTWATKNNNNLRPHVTLNVASLPTDASYGSMEVALSRDHMVSTSSSIVRPHVAIITSIGTGHSEAFLNSGKDPFEAVFEEKMSIAKSVVDGGSLVLPSFQDNSEKMLKVAKTYKNLGQIITCGYLDSDDVQIIEQVEHSTKSDVRIKVLGQEISYTIPSTGLHLIQDSALAIGAAVACGIPFECFESVKDTNRTMSAFTRFRGQFQDKTVEIINDSFNSTDVNVLGFCKMLSERKNVSRRILVLGDIPRLADFSKEIHEGLAPKIDGFGFDHVFAAGPNMAYMVEKLKTPATHFANYRSMVKNLYFNLQNGDLIGLNGSAYSDFGNVFTLLKKRAKSVKVASVDWSIDKETENSPK